ncbi:MAG: precorrin-6y C5,15-methyltransferase (decarboxylating) subunit CbiE [Alphaproteobacteria bacterium]|nr:precorrin-6y C5,15-methyltransferase (decarboxylating) subunit CbiE [Alphaproteobacteria bacterium]
MKRWLAVIGVGEDGLAGLSPAARALVGTAEVLVGGVRHLGMAPDTAAERIVWERPLRQTIDAIAARRGRRVTVLASGDPMWYGIGVTLSRRFSREEVVIVPQLSAFSLAAARLGWPVAECATITLHGRPLDTLRLHLAPGRRILALSEDGTTPRAVAALLTGLGWGPSELTVLAHMSGSREASITDKAQLWGGRRVPDLNTMAIDCRPESGARALPLLPGLPDDVFEHDGQLTKREVRAATLAALGPLPGETLWDIGAGCGSIAIEWLRAGEGRSAVAIEREPARAAMIARNAASLGVPGLRVMPGSAPEALRDLSRPDAIFIGGGIGAASLLAEAWQSLLPGGRLVANVVTTEGEARLFDWHARHGGALTRLCVARAQRHGPHHLWRSLATVTQFAAVKSRNGE